MPKPRLYDEDPIVIDPDRVPDPGLRVGDGDGFVAVLEAGRDRLVIGTAPGWDRAMLVWGAAVGFALLAGVAAGAVRAADAPGPLPMAGLCLSTPCLFVGLAVGVYMGKSFRNRLVIDGRRREITRTTRFGLARQGVYVEAVVQVAAGEIYFADRTDEGLKVDEDEPGVLAVLLYNQRGRPLLEVEGLPGRAPEAAFYLLVAARAAAILGVPLALYKPPDDPARPVRALWAALAAADQDAVDRWHDRSGRRPRLFTPVVVYAVLGLAGVLALGCGLRWLSVTAALGVFAGLLAGGTLVLAGAALLATGWQPGVRPSAYSFAARLAPLNHFGVAPVAGSVLIALGGLSMLGLTAATAVFPPPAVAEARASEREARDRARRAEAERPHLTYRVETRPDGTRDVRLEVRNMHPVDVGLELLGAPEPEVREKGVQELEFHVDRKHPRRAQVVAGLTLYLASDKAEIRRHAVQGLGKWGWAETAGVLEPMLADPDERVRAAARDAIRDIGTRQKRGDV